MWGIGPGVGAKCFSAAATWARFFVFSRLGKWASLMSSWMVFKYPDTTGTEIPALQCIIHQGMICEV